MKKIILLVIGLMLSTSVFGAVTVDLDINNQFILGEDIKFRYSFTSEQDAEVSYIVGVDCPEAILPLLSIRKLNLKAGETFSDEYFYITVDDETESQTCIARASVLEPEIIVEEEFEIIVKPSIEYHLTYCKNRACSVKTKVFTQSDTVYFDVDAEQVSAEITKPDKSTIDINIPTQVVLDQIGVYQITALAVKSGFKDTKQEDQIVVIKDKADIKEESVCTVDGVCSAEESYQNCPQDCVSGQDDNYCDTESDNKCDPDCKTDEDIDCILPLTSPETKTITQIKKQSNQNMVKYIVIGILFCLTVLLYILSIGKKK